MGFVNVKGSCITTLEPMTEKIISKNKKIIISHSKRFLKIINNTKRQKPSLLEVIFFRISRNKIKTMLDENYKNYTYYKEHGWFDSDYFYPVNLNNIEKLLGKLVDYILKNS